MEAVADKGYHSNATMTGVKERSWVTYVLSEPNRGRLKWKGKRDAQKATYANRRGSGATGASGCSAGAGRRWSGLAHMLETGGMRRTFGARRIFENECSSTRRPSTSGSSCASGSALEPPVHCRASLPYKLHSQLRLQPASCAFSPVSGGPSRAEYRLLTPEDPLLAQQHRGRASVFSPSIRWAPTSSTGCTTSRGPERKRRMSRRSEEQDQARSGGRPKALPKRWSAQRKAAVVMRLRELGGLGCAAGAGAVAARVPGREPAGPEGEEKNGS